MQILQITTPFPADSPFIHSLAKVFRAARTSHLHFLNTLHTPEEDRAFLSTQMPPAHQVWIANTLERPAGFIIFSDGCVHHLYLHPDFQRRNLGSRLLNCAKASDPTLRLWIFQVNDPALQFYTRQGFRPVDKTDGTSNEARQPDLLLEWHSPNTLNPPSP